MQGREGAELKSSVLHKAYPRHPAPTGDRFSLVKNGRLRTICEYVTITL